MKRIQLLLITQFLFCIQVFSQIERDSRFISIEGNNTSNRRISSKFIGNGFRVIDSAYYYITISGKDTIELPLQETITYKVDSKPELTISNISGNTTINKLERLSIFIANPTIVHIRPDIETTYFSDNTENVSHYITLPTKRKLKEEKYTQRDIRNTYISTLYEYKNAKCFYFFANYSPNVSYRRLVPIEPTTEYYDYVAQAQQSDKSVTHAKDDWNIGLGYAYGTGNSFVMSYSQFYNYYKTENVNTNNSSINKGIFLSYRYQRIHMSNCVQPVAEISYGIINGSRNDAHKLGLGLSFMLWSKNLYFNSVPYFRSNFRSNSVYTGKNEIGATPYCFGADMGLVYKFWRARNRH